MLSCCLKCKKNTENINPKVSKTSNGKTMLLSKFSIKNSRKAKFIKNQEGSKILSNLAFKTLLNK